MTESDPAETSPLLGRPPPASKNADNSIQTSVLDVQANGDQPIKRTEPREDEEEGQLEDEDRKAQMEGMPEVRKRMKYILPAMAIGIFLSAVDLTIIVSSYGKIGSDLKALNNTSWIATAYFLTLTSFQPLYGKLSDIFGRKAALLFAYAIFGTGCLFCGLARNMNELIAARACTGIGGGGMTTVVSILMSDIIPLRERGVWQGYINIIYASGAGVGAPLGGAMADTIGWRVAFIAQGPLCLIALISVAATLRLPKQEDSDWKTKLKRVDFIGAFVMVFAVFALVLGLDRGSNVSWRSTTTIVSLCVSALLFPLFGIIEQKVALEPFTPSRIIFDRGMFACYASVFFSSGGWLAALFYLPLFFQAVDGLSATGAGIRLLPAIVTGVMGSLFAGIVMKRTGKYFWMTVIAYTMMTVGMIPVLLSTGLVANNTYGISVGLVLIAFGNGIGVTTTLISLIRNAAPQDQAIATAGSYLFRSLGSVTGIALSSSVVQQTLRTELQSRLHSGTSADEIVKGVRQSLDFIKTLDPDVRDVVRHCYEDATRYGFFFMLAVIALAMVSSCRCPLMIFKDVTDKMPGFIREKNLSH